MASYPKGYCAINTENGEKYGDHRLAIAIARGCGCGYHDCKTKIDEQIKWVLDHFRKVNEVCLSNAMQECWYDHIGTATQPIWDYIDQVIADKVEEGLVSDTWS